MPVIESNGHESWECYGGCGSHFGNTYALKPHARLSTAAPDPRAGDGVSHRIRCSKRKNKNRTETFPANKSSPALPENGSKNISRCKVRIILRCLACRNFAAARELAKRSPPEGSRDPARSLSTPHTRAGFSSARRARQKVFRRSNGGDWTEGLTRNCLEHTLPRRPYFVPSIFLQAQREVKR